MRLTAVISSLALALPVIAAPTVPAIGGQAIVKNKSGQSVWIVSVASKSGTLQEYKNGDTFSQDMFNDPNAGVAIKIGTSENSVYTAGASELTFAYALNQNENAVYYDLSSVNQVDPLWSGLKLTLAPSDPNCPTIVWDHLATATPQDTKACSGDNVDLTLTLGA